MVRKSGLGKGLDALIPSSDTTPLPPSQGVLQVFIKDIIPNPRQPRALMNETDLKELAESIREHGVIQPLIVTRDPGDGKYILIAGERRLRASQLAGLKMVPVIVRSASDQERLELALIENVQRADLTPLETAEAYRHLYEEFHLSHEDIAIRVGKSRVTITNTLRLLKLPASVRQSLAEGQISEGHARALLGLPTPQAQTAALETVLKQDFTVRQTEELVKKMLGEKAAKAAKPAPLPEVQELEERLRGSLGTKVTLRYGKKGGTITIHYFSDEELNGLLGQLTRE